MLNVVVVVVVVVNEVLEVIVLVMVLMVEVGGSSACDSGKSTIKKCIAGYHISMVYASHCVGLQLWEIPPTL